jgi:hypothetical protein
MRHGSRAGLLAYFAKQDHRRRAGPKIRKTNVSNQRAVLASSALGLLLGRSLWIGRVSIVGTHF